MYLGGMTGNNLSYSSRNSRIILGARGRQIERALCLLVMLLDRTDIYLLYCTIIACAAV